MAISAIAAGDQTSLRKGPPCAVCAALEQLPEVEADGLRKLLADPTWRFTSLSAALAADEDYPLNIPDFTLAKHARGQCAARTKMR